MIKKKIRIIAINTFLIFISVLLTLCLVEGLSYVYLKFKPLPDPLGIFDFRIKYATPYKDAEYFSQEFHLESIESAKESAMTIHPNYRYVVHGDYQGKFFNVKNHCRVTTNQPKSFKNTIYFFGGSTVFCQEVPDYHTIASYLQRLVNEKYPNTYIVRNFGTCAATSYHQLGRLLDTPVNPVDIVIFYDGVNDIVFSVERDRHAQKNFVALNPFEKKLKKLYIQYGECSTFVRLLYSLDTNVAVGKRINLSVIKEKLVKTCMVYFAVLQNAFHYAQQHKAKFYHFLQPNIFTLPKHTKYEELIIKNDRLVSHAFSESFEFGYPALRKVGFEARKRGIQSKDLSSVLDKRDTDEEFYLDAFHMNHKANQRVAEAIFQEIFP